MNARIFEACRGLPEGEFHKERTGSFRSIHRLLNHILLGDRTWMERFTTMRVVTTPPLGEILYEDLESLWQARQAEDARIELFLAGINQNFIGTSIRYINSSGREYNDSAALLLQHMFNHQTHHRGQIHVMLSEAGAKPVNMDLHRAIQP